MGYPKSSKSLDNFSIEPHAFGDFPFEDTCFLDHANFIFLS
jgi:hypothetical protein